MPPCGRQGRRNNYRDAPPINQDARFLSSSFLFFLLYPRLNHRRSVYSPRLFSLPSFFSLSPPPLSLRLRLSTRLPPLRLMFRATQSVQREKERERENSVFITLDGPRCILQADSSCSRGACALRLRARSRGRHQAQRGGEVEKLVVSDSVRKETFGYETRAPMSVRWSPRRGYRLP